MLSNLKKLFLLAGITMHLLSCAPASATPPTPSATPTFMPIIFTSTSTSTFTPTPSATPTVYLRPVELKKVFGPGWSDSVQYILTQRTERSDPSTGGKKDTFTTNAQNMMIIMKKEGKTKVIFLDPRLIAQIKNGVRYTVWRFNTKVNIVVAEKEIKKIVPNAEINFAMRGYENTSDYDWVDIQFHYGGAIDLPINARIKYHATLMDYGETESFTGGRLETFVCEGQQGTEYHFVVFNEFVSPCTMISRKAIEVHFEETITDELRIMQWLMKQSANEGKNANIVKRYWDGQGDYADWKPLQSFGTTATPEPIPFEGFTGNRTYYDPDEMNHNSGHQSVAIVEQNQLYVITTHPNKTMEGSLTTNLELATNIGAYSDCHITRAEATGIFWKTCYIFQINAERFKTPGLINWEFFQKTIDGLLYVNPKWQPTATPAP